MVAPWKYEEVRKIKEFISSYPVVGIVSIHGIPANFFQQLRRTYKENGVYIRVAKKNLIIKALEQLAPEKEGIINLKNFMEGEVALVGTDKMNAFKLFKFIESTKTPAYAKGGEIAPKDIVVPAGETPFRPGPILSEFQSVGLPVAVERGKIVIKKDTVLVKQGERIPKNVAQILTRLDIKPIMLGFEVQAIYEDGITFKPDDLRIDEEQIKTDIITLVRNAFALAISIAWPTSETIVPLIQKAHREAIAVALEAAYPEPEIMDLLIQKAFRAAISIALNLPKEALDEKTAELISGVQAQQATVVQEASSEERKEEEKKEEKEEKKEEEEALAGLSALFG